MISYLLTNGQTLLDVKLLLQLKKKEIMIENDLYLHVVVFDATKTMFYNQKVDLHKNLKLMFPSIALKGFLSKYLIC